MRKQSFAGENGEEDGNGVARDMANIPTFDSTHSSPSTTTLTRLKANRRVGAINGRDVGSCILGRRRQAQSGE